MKMDDYIKQMPLQMPQKQMPATEGKKDEELMKAAQEFESIFMNMVMKSMRETVPESGLIDSSKSDFYQGLLDEEYAKMSPKSSKNGLADMIYEHLSRAQPKNTIEPTGEEGARNED